MEREFVTYEQALALKYLGFDERCIGRYCIVTEWEEPTGEILLQFIDCELSEKTLVKAPLKQQIFRFFREKYDIYVEIGHGPRIEFYYNIYKDAQRISEYGHYATYEEAENACIDKLIEIVKEQKKIDLIAEISGW
jgi:hypothetical protein